MNYPAQVTLTIIVERIELWSPHPACFSVRRKGRVTGNRCSNENQESLNAGKTTVSVNNHPPSAYFLGRRSWNWPHEVRLATKGDLPAKRTGSEDPSTQSEHCVSRRSSAHCDFSNDRVFSRYKSRSWPEPRQEDEM